MYRNFIIGMNILKYMYTVEYTHKLQYGTKAKWARPRR